MCERREVIEPEPCLDLTQEEVDLEGWCKTGYEQESCAKECFTEDCQCLDTTQDVVLYANDNKLKLIMPMEECMNWPEAQIYCCETYGGKLWEPQNATEYSDVLTEWNAIVSILYLLESLSECPLFSKRIKVFFCFTNTC